MHRLCIVSSARNATPLEVVVVELIEHERKGLSLRTLAADIARLEATIARLGKLHRCQCGQHVFGSNVCERHEQPA